MQILTLYKDKLVSRYHPKSIRVQLTVKLLLQANANIPALNRIRWNVRLVDSDDIVNAMVLPVSIPNCFVHFPTLSFADR